MHQKVYDKWNAKKVKTFVHIFHIILINDLKILHILQHIVLRMLIQEQSNNHIKVSVIVDNV
jgi:hypothetical protein